MALPPGAMRLDVDMAVLGVDGAGEQAARVAPPSGAPERPTGWRRRRPECRPQARCRARPRCRRAGPYSFPARPSRRPGSGPRSRLPHGETSRSISGSSASACPRSIGMVSRASGSPSPVEDAGRAGAEGGIDGKDAQCSSPSGGVSLEHEDRRAGNRLFRRRCALVTEDGCAPSGRHDLGKRDARPPQTAWTSRTSGRKWRSRFWMPWRRVAVEEGQPEQAPFMTR